MNVMRMQQSSIVSRLNELREQGKRAEAGSADKLDSLRIGIVQTIKSRIQEVEDANPQAGIEKTSRLHTLRTFLDAGKKPDSQVKDEYAPDLSLLLRTFVEEGKQMATTQKILDSLYFKELKERQSNIKNSHAQTYEWIFDKNGPHGDVKFMHWLETGSNVYWVAGKAGSGKSTLMKLLCRHECTRKAIQHWAGKDTTSIVASHFFWNCGNQMQTSQTGLLQSLLYQILWQCPTLVEIACQSRWQADGVIRHAPNYWTDEELSAAFNRLSVQDQKPVKICIFVDGLDEYRGNHKDIISILEQAGSSRNIKVCVSSRPWNVFENAFGESENRMMLQRYTINDITDCVTDTLNNDSQFAKLAQKDDRAKDLMDQVVSKANGVFLWIFLVVRSILQGLTDDNEITDLQRRVRDLPEDLEDYFKLMLSTIEPFYRAQTAHIFLITLQAMQPQSIVVHSFSEDVINDPQFALGEIQALTDDQIRSMHEKQRKYLNARSKDLLEITEAPEGRGFLRYRVDFLHRTVRDFLSTRDVYDDFREKAAPRFDARKSLCRMHLAQIKAFVPHFFKEPYPLMDLVAEFMHDTYDVEVAHGIPEIEHLEELDRVMSKATKGLGYRQWTECLHGNDDRKTTFLSIAVEARLLRYVDHCLKEDPSRIEEGRNQPLLSCALERGAWAHDWLPLEESYFDLEMIRMLLESGANPNAKVKYHGGITVWNAFLLKCTLTRDAGEKRREIARTYGKQLFQIAEMFIEYGANVDLKNESKIFRFEQIDSPHPSAGEILQAYLEPADWDKLRVMMAEKRQPGIMKWLKGFRRK